MNEIAIDDINALLKDTEKEYLIIVFGGIHLPKYDSLVYCHNNNIYALNHDIKDRFTYYLDENELDSFNKYLRFALSTHNYNEIKLKKLKDVLKELKTMGYEKLDYIEL
ncbi:hypothetical protein [Carnobacterium mobile]|uniref:hypothetical protein n=1 Tax=Carnobacterium mobile TaxID=2750 RepID=UPI000550E7FA|nr:hypothetical protein [Carnobacterium mobile]